MRLIESKRSRSEVELPLSACGTVRKNVNGMPSFRKFAQGQQAYQTTGELLALKWMDKREVHLLTTLHEHIMAKIGKNDRKTCKKIKKPLCITQYNKKMRAVDQVDMQNTKMVLEIVFSLIRYQCAELMCHIQH